MRLQLKSFVIIYGINWQNHVHLLLEIKRKMIKVLNDDESLSEITSTTQRLVVYLKNVRTLLEKLIDDFVRVNISKLFNRLPVGTNFLSVVN